MSQDLFNKVNKEEQFRRYLDKKKVRETLSEILVKLYREEKKPKVPLKYVKDKLEIDCNPDTCLWEIRCRISEALTRKVAVKSTIEELRCHNAAIRKAIEKRTAEIVFAPPSTHSEVPLRSSCIRTLDSLRTMTIGNTHFSEIKNSVN